MHALLPTQRSLRESIYLLIGLILVATLVMMIGGILFFLKGAEDEFWNSRLTDASTQAATLLGSYLDDSYLSLKSLVNLHDQLLNKAGTGTEVWHDPVYYRELETAARALLDQDPALLELAITYNSTAMDIRVASESAADEPILDDVEALWTKDWSHYNLDDQTFLSPLIIPEDEDEAPYIIMCIRQDDGSVAAARIDMGRLTEVIAAISIGDTGDAYVADIVDGRVVLHYEGDEEQEVYDGASTPSVLGHPALNPAAVESQTRWSGRFTNFAQEPVYAVSAFVPRSNWVIFAEVSQEEHDSLSNNAVLILSALMLALFAVIFVVMTRLLSRRIFTPLDTLYQGSRQITTDNLSQHIPVSRPDEIGAVTQSFNDMLGRLSIQTGELRQARDEALEHNRLKSQFLSTMSHELRTPLNAIDGYASLMLMTGLSGETGEWAERIRVNSRILLNQINDVLEFSRLDAGRTTIRYKETRLTDMVSQWKSLISPLAADRKLEFRIEVDPKLPALVQTDDIALTRIVSNLLGNAVKFTKEGYIGLRLALDGDAHWLIEVSDSGIGIPPEAQGYIYEDFRQVDESTTRTYGGSGLGLAIVRRILVLMGGAITLQSEVGKGSTFTVRLPLKPVPAES